MSQKYALPCCDCGTVLAVEVRHAGSTMTCDKCGRSLDVPKLREIKRLEPVQEITSTKQTAWTQLQGVLFALGLLMLAVAASSSLYTYKYRSSFDGITKPADEEIHFDLDIQEISLVDSWKTWNQFKVIKLDSRQTPLHVYARERIATLNKYLMLFAALAGSGAVLMVASVAIRPRSVR